MTAIHQKLCERDPSVQLHDVVFGEAGDLFAIAAAGRNSKSIAHDLSEPGREISFKQIT